MECIEARALKSSFLLSQMAMKTTTSQMFQNDDVWGCVAPDDFPVEDLLNLDFPDKGLTSFPHKKDGDDDEDEDELPQKESSNYSSSTFSGADEIDSLSELAVPVDDLDNLEWLSQFVDDSTTGLSLLCPAISGNGQPQQIRAPYFHVPVPVKARSKRSRKSSGRSWLPPAAGPSTLSRFLFMDRPVHGAEKPAGKKQKRKPESESGPGRKCTHCQVQKTPQWRTGPLGPKTLCNACGVRFKSGRLFPEYRPAFSPTFMLEMHSNSHRKVLEMRRKKEVGPGFTEAVRDLGGLDQNAGFGKPVAV